VSRCPSRTIFSAEMSLAVFLGGRGFLKASGNKGQAPSTQPTDHGCPLPLGKCAGPKV
jgi:hypothetical protein